MSEEPEATDVLYEVRSAKIPRQVLASPEQTLNISGISLSTAKIWAQDWLASQRWPEQVGRARYDPGRPGTTILTWDLMTNDAYHVLILQPMPFELQLDAL